MFKNIFSKRSPIAAHKPQDLCSKPRQQISLWTFQYCSSWEVSEWIDFWHWPFTDIGQNTSTFFFPFPCTITYSLTNKYFPPHQNRYKGHYGHIFAIPELACTEAVFLSHHQTSQFTVLVLAYITGWESLSSAPLQ